MSDFVYYLRGANIAILEREDTSEVYSSPKKDITDGLMFEYSSMPSVPDSEDDVIDMSDELCLAAVEYAKSRFAESVGEYEKRNFHMNEFRRRVYQYQRNRFGGIRKVMGQNPFAIR
jgi:hypothetical protein